MISLDTLALGSSAWFAFCTAGALLFAGGIAYERGLSRGRADLLTYQRDSAQRALRHLRHRAIVATGDYRWPHPPTGEQSAPPLGGDPDPATFIREWDDNRDRLPTPNRCDGRTLGPDTWLCPPDVDDDNHATIPPDLYLYAVDLGHWQAVP